jgi:hypothetical protein
LREIYNLAICLLILRAVAVALSRLGIAHPNIKLITNRKI